MQFLLPTLHRTLIVGLLFVGRPLAILFAVWAVIVDAFNCVSGSIGWFHSHVRDEVLKRFKPALAYRYSPTAPVFELGVIGICASLNHICKTVVLRCVTHIVRGVYSSHFIGINTSTAFGMAVTQLGSTSNGLVSTVTNTFPACNFPRIYFCKYCHCKPTESLAGNILEVMPSFYDQFISHKLNSYLVLVRAHFRLKIGDELDFILVPVV